jgi:hypothetical protein
MIFLSVPCRIFAGDDDTRYLGEKSQQCCHYDVNGPSLPEHRRQRIVVA